MTDDPWANVAALIGSVDAPPDWSARHDHDPATTVPSPPGPPTVTLGECKACGAWTTVRDRLCAECGEWE